MTGFTAASAQYGLQYNWPAGTVHMQASCAHLFLSGSIVIAYNLAGRNVRTPSSSRAAAAAVSG